MKLPSDLLIRALIRRLFATDAAGLRLYETPAHDPGLFGADTVTWRIHADFPGMMSGGICALMLQTLHPRALAGVWDHSNFRQDLLGRLRRTTQFVAVTSFAPTDVAQQAIARVRTIHQHVTGTLEDGTPYRADDPALLTWVHVTEMWSFLRGYEHYRCLRVPDALADRYFDETRRVAEALGARGVPASRAAVEAYFERVQPDLRYSARSAAVLDVLARVPLPVALRPARGLFLGSGAALLPEWALDLMRRPPRRRWADRASALQLRGVAPLIRRALRDGVSARACRRVGLDPAWLQRWPQDA